MPRARARQFFSSGLGFGLETQKPGLGLGLGLETCWTRTRTRVLRIWTWTRTRTRDMRTRTRLGLEETRTRCISENNSSAKNVENNQIRCPTQSDPRSNPPRGKRTRSSISMICMPFAFLNRITSELNVVVVNTYQTRHNLALIIITNRLSLN